MRGSVSLIRHLPDSTPSCGRRPDDRLNRATPEPGRIQPTFSQAVPHDRIRPEGGPSSVTCGPREALLWKLDGLSEREQIVELYHRAWAHSDATIDTLALDAIGHVPWWPDDHGSADPR